ncbi:MAG: type II toxin-antitoxin system HicA family toxin [Candidatus Uhrbacteria bacterium]
MPKILPVSYKKLIWIFEKEGFILLRTKGDHLVYFKKGILRPVVIPMYDNVPIFIIKNLLRTTGISREKYFELLNQC